MNVCVYVCLCRSLGRFWEPIRCLPEPEGAAGGQRSPRMKDSLYPRWLAEERPLGRFGHDWPRADAEQKGEQKTMKKKKRSRCVLTGRTREGQRLR